MFWSFTFCFVGYKSAFIELASRVGELLQFGQDADAALETVKKFLSQSRDLQGDSLRLLGSASQSLKTCREKEYISKADSSFKVSDSLI